MTKLYQGQTPLPLARTVEQWRSWAESEGLRAFHGNQIFKWLHAKRVVSSELMTDLSKDVRGRLSSQLTGFIPQIDDVHEASDGTRKLVIRMTDNSCVETVLIPMTSDDDIEDSNSDESPEHAGANPIIRVTQCISTQVGCAMNCAFCASGYSGLKRNLRPDEIVAQVILSHAYLKQNERLSNLVVMGMGEPLHNYDATVQAVRLIGCPDGLGLSSRKISISTVGLVPELQRLGQDFQGKIGLAVSLHAADDQTRSKLIPINRRYSLDVLIKALHSYPLAPRRRIMIEYALIEDQNDSDKMAAKLVRLLRGLTVKVNLIPLNYVSHAVFRPSSMSRILAFQRVLTDAGLSCFIRKSRGDSISAACGQLAGKQNFADG